MILSCPKCYTRYVVPDTAIGPQGRSVRCAACKHSWFQAPGDATASAEPVEPAMSGPAAAAEPSSPSPAASEPTPPPPSASIPIMHDDAEPAPEPPFRPRRNPARLWTMAAVAFALLLTAGAAAVYTWGAPAWIERLGISASANEPDLLIELSESQDYRELADGTIYFAASGTIINPTDREQAVPPIMAELVDAQGRVVFRWVIRPPRDTLPPGERVNFSEAKLDIPRSATDLTTRWALDGE